MSASRMESNRQVKAQMVLMLTFELAASLTAITSQRPEKETTEILVATPQTHLHLARLSSNQRGPSSLVLVTSHHVEDP